MLNRSPLERRVPFSSYAGFDRLLLVLAGALALEIDGRLLALASRNAAGSAARQP
jgi:environmental stress-induced protein Ves